MNCYVAFFYKVVLQVLACLLLLQEAGAAPDTQVLQEAGGSRRPDVRARRLAAGEPQTNFAPISAGDSSSHFGNTLSMMLIC